MQNIIEVSDQYKEFCKDELSFRDHTIYVKNITKDIEFTDTPTNSKSYIQSISIDVKEKSDQGNSQTNIVNFDLIIRNKDNIDISTLIEKGDIIQIQSELNGENPTIYTGYVQEIPTEYENLKQTYSITLYDKIYNGIDNEFQQDETHITKCICNNSDKNNSLAHQLAYKMDFLDSQIQFEDVTDKKGNYLSVYYTEWKQGEKILSEFTELVKAIKGKLFVNHAGKFILSTPFNDDDFNNINFTFDTNILGKPNKTPIPAKYDATEVNYSKFKIEERQIVWQWIENNYDKKEDLANIRLEANEETVWIKFEYLTPIVIEPEDTPEVLFEDSASEEVNLDYELELHNNYGKVKFTNNNNFPVYIQRFKIYGKPLAKFDGNKSTYTETQDPDNTLALQNNKYIQSQHLASLNAQYSHHLNCKDRVKYDFDSTYLPFLEVSNRCNLNGYKLSDDIIIQNFKHKISSNNKRTKITAINYIPYKFENPIFIDEDSGTYPDYEVIKRMNDIRDSTVITLDTPPPAPTNLKYESAYQMIKASWDKVDREDVKGYNVYVYDGTSVNLDFIQATKIEFFAEKGKEYTIQVAAVTLRDLESEKSTAITAKTLEEITIPEEVLEKSELIKHLQEATEENGVTISKLKNEYNVKVQTAENGQTYIAGYGLALEEGISEFGILADRFKIYKTDGTGQPVFALDTNKDKLYLLGDLVADGTITARMLSTDKLITRNSQIGDAVINTANVDFLSVDKLTSGNLTESVRIENGKIIYERRNYDSVTNLLNSAFPARETEELSEFWDSKIEDSAGTKYYDRNGNLIKIDNENGTTYYNSQGQETYKQTNDGEIIATNFEIDNQGQARFSNISYDSLNVNFAKVNKTKVPIYSPYDFDIEIIHSAKTKEDFNIFKFTNFELLKEPKFRSEVIRDYRGYFNEIVVDKVNDSFPKGQDVYIQDHLTRVYYRVQLSAPVSASETNQRIKIEHPDREREGEKVYLNIGKGSRLISGDCYKKRPNNFAMHNFELTFRGLNVLKGLYQADLNHLPFYKKQSDGTYIYQGELQSSPFDYQTKLYSNAFGFGGKRAIFGHISQKFHARDNESTICFQFYFKKPIDTLFFVFKQQAIK